MKLKLNEINYLAMIHQCLDTCQNISS